MQQSISSSLISRAPQCLCYIHNYTADYHRSLIWQRHLQQGLITKAKELNQEREKKMLLNKDEKDYQQQHHHSDIIVDDRIIMLQHRPVYTIGRGSDINNILGDIYYSNDSKQFIKLEKTNDSQLPNVAASLKIKPPGAVYNGNISQLYDLVKIERGGEVTYHGPGQIVFYPILNLSNKPHKRDLHWLVRSLEQVVINMLKNEFGIEDASRCNGLTGVWIGKEKISALGIGVKNWVSIHGISLNVTRSCLDPFNHIIPCGISPSGDDARGVTTIANELRKRGKLVTENKGLNGDSSSPIIVKEEEDRKLIERVQIGLLKEFENVFYNEIAKNDPNKSIIRKMIFDNIDDAEKHMMSQ